MIETFLAAAAGAYVGCDLFVSSVARATEEESRRVRYMEELCRKLNEGYDFSGTERANENNKALWRKHRSLFEDVINLDGDREKAVMISIVRYEHEKNVKYLAEHPGEWNKEKAVYGYTPCNNYGLIILFDQR